MEWIQIVGWGVPSSADRTRCLPDTVLPSYRKSFRSTSLGAAAAILKFQMEVGTSVLFRGEKQSGIVVLSGFLTLAILQANAAIRKQLLNHAGGKMLPDTLEKGIVPPENKATFLVAAEPALLFFQHIRLTAGACSDSFVI